MQEIMKIGFVVSLIRMLALVFATMGIISLTKDAIKDYRTEGLKGITQEVLIGIALIAVTVIVVFSLHEVAEIIDMIINWLFEAFKSFLSFANIA